MIILQKASHLALMNTINWQVDSMMGTVFDSIEWSQILGENQKGTLIICTPKKRVLYFSFEREPDSDNIKFELIGMSSPKAKKLYSLLEKVHSALANNNAEEAYNLIDYELYVKPESDN